MFNKKMNLRQLIIDNPGLDLVPFVSDECGNPDYRYTMSEFTKAKVDAYTQNPHNDEEVLIKSEDYNRYREDVLTQSGAERGYDGGVDETQIREAYDSLDWTPGILIYIDAY